MKKNNSRKIRRAACVLAAGLMIGSVGAVFTGCGNNNSNNNTALVDQQEAAKTLAYKVSDITLQTESNLDSRMVYKNGSFYGVTYDYEEKNGVYYSSSDIVVFDSTGNLTMTIPVFHQTKENEYGGINGSVQLDKDGNISCLMYYGTYDETTGESKDSTFLLKFDSTGKEISRTDASKFVTQEDMNNNLYLNNVLIDDQGYIYLNLGRCIRVCDSNGNVLFDTEMTDENSGWINNMFTTNSGAVAICMYEFTDEKSVLKIKEVDVNAKAYGKEYVLNTSNYGETYSGSGDYLCYMMSSTGIMGVRADNQQTENVLNLLNLGIDNSYVSSFNVNDDGSFIAIGSDYSGMTTKTILNMIEPVAQSEVKEKTIITLGCFYLDWNIRSSIAEFNKTNENYTIYCTSYSDTNDTNDYSAALTKFNNEILAGNVPDILLISSGMPYDSYASKGLFTDLYALMDKDPEFTRDAFMPNVLKGMERDGKLYEIAPTFTVQTYAVKKSLVSDPSTFTVDKANELLASLGEDAKMFNYSDVTASEYVMNAVNYLNFVDYKSGTCNFDSPEFKAVLEAAKAYPKEIDYDALYNENPDYWMEQEKAIRENRALLASVYLGDFSSYTQTRDGIFGEDITFVGYPGSVEMGGGTGILMPTCEIAISEKSEYKDGAWEFVKSILNDTLVEEVNEDTGKTIYRVQSYGLPVLKSQIEKVALQATIPMTYTDENGNEVEYDNTYWIGNEEIKVKYLTEAEGDMLIDYLSTVDRIVRYDENLMNIINEDVAAFVNGTKSADETASIIQSRVSIYLSEQY